MLQKVCLLETVGDATTVEVVDGKLHRHLVARQDLDVVHTHLAGDVGGDFVAVFQLYAKHRVAEGLDDGAVLFDC